MLAIAFVHPHTEISAISVFVPFLVAEVAVQVWISLYNCSLVCILRLIRTWILLVAPLLAYVALAIYNFCFALIKDCAGKERKNHLRYLRFGTITAIERLKEGKVGPAVFESKSIECWMEFLVWKFEIIDPERMLSCKFSHWSQLRIVGSAPSFPLDKTGFLFLVLLLDGFETLI